MLGSFLSAQSLLALAAWEVVFSFLAVRFFRNGHYHPKITPPVPCRQPPRPDQVAKFRC